MARVLQCTDYNETTQTCVAEAWVEETATGVLPPLSVEEAQLIGAAILLTWAVGFVFRAVLKTIAQS